MGNRTAIITQACSHLAPIPPLTTSSRLTGRNVSHTNILRPPLPLPWPFLFLPLPSQAILAHSAAYELPGHRTPPHLRPRVHRKPAYCSQHLAVSTPSTKQQKEPGCKIPPPIPPKMLFIFVVLMALVSALPGMLGQSLTRPALEVPACPTTGTVSYNTSVPDGGLFPLTQVDLCYDDSSIHIKFTAFEEKDFYCMPTWSPILLAFIRPSLFSPAPY